MDYRHAPVGYVSPAQPPPHGYPYPPPYYGGPPPPYGMPPPGAYPPYYGHPGYGPPPPPPQSRSVAGGGGGGYAYGYDPNYGYPSQQPVKKHPDSIKMPQRKTVSGRGSRSSTSPAPVSSDPVMQQQHHQQPWRAPSASPDSSSPVGASMSTSDFAPSQVKPIETDFHFFAKEMSVALRPAAEAEVQASLKTFERSMSPVDLLCLINTNLNSRIIKAWEDLTPVKRAEYLTKEENDRRRFMTDDNVASRHCATLTARNKSPRADNSSKNTSNSNKESRDPAEHRNGKPSPAQSTGSESSSGGVSDEIPEEESNSPRRDTSPLRSSTLKPLVKAEEEDDDEEEPELSYTENMATEPQKATDNGNTVGKSDDVKPTESNIKTDEDELTGKRIGSPTTLEEEEGTPPKRNRREGEGNDLDHHHHDEAREAI